jgi:hypothetical protein
MRAVLVAGLYCLGMSVFAQEPPPDPNLHIAPATIDISKLPLVPGQNISVHTKFHQGVAFAPIGGLGCGTPPNDTHPCDGSRSLGLLVWKISTAGIQAPNALVNIGDSDFKPPTFYTVIEKTYGPFEVPSVQPGESLAFEIIFTDKVLETITNVVRVKEVPRVLGSKRFTWVCRTGKAGAKQCAYIAAKTS